jgi:hypothetical protein
MFICIYVCMQVRVCVCLCLCGCVYGVIGRLVWNYGYIEEYQQRWMNNDEELGDTTSMGTSKFILIS